jgi:hypothetical protein
VVTGVTMLPNQVGDATNTLLNFAIDGLNKVAGTHVGRLGMPTAATQSLLSSAGLPAPATPAERVVEAASTTMVSAGAGIAAAGSLASTVSPSMIKAMLSDIGSGSTRELASAALSGGSRQTVKEMGGGAVPQLVASMLGAALPYGLDAATAGLDLLSNANELRSVVGADNIAEAGLAGSKDVMRKAIGQAQRDLTFVQENGLGLEKGQLSDLSRTGLLGELANRGVRDPRVWQAAAVEARRLLASGQGMLGPTELIALVTNKLLANPVT